MLAPIVEPDQIAMIVKQLQPETVTKQNHLLWDVENNCIQQEENHMIGKALQDYQSITLPCKHQGHQW